MSLAKSGNLRVIKAAVESRGANLNDIDEFGKTAVWHGAMNGHLDVTTYLLPKYSKDKCLEAINERFTFLPFTKYQL